MANLFYGLSFAFACGMLVFSGWVTAEGILLWHQAVGVLSSVILAVMTIGWSWQADTPKEGRHK